MSRKQKRLLKTLAVVYFAALLVYLLSIGRSRNRWRRPELVPGRQEIPQQGSLPDEEFAEAKEEFVGRGFLLRAKAAGAPELEVNDAIGAEELDRLVEAKSPPVLVWDPRLVREFAARKLRAGEMFRDERGNLVANVGDELTEDVLVRMALAYDQKKDEAERHERIWVKGTGSIVGLDLTLVFTALNFLVLVGALYAFLWEPVTRLLDDRAEAIREDVDNARRRREEAEELREARELELSKLRGDADRLRAEARRQGEIEKAELVRQGRAEARRIAERQERALAAEEERAKQEAAGALGEASVALASKVLEREVGPEDHERLVGEFIDELAKGLTQERGGSSEGASS